jgi:hypothetical protein
MREIQFTAYFDAIPSQTKFSQILSKFIPRIMTKIGYKIKNKLCDLHTLYLFYTLHVLKIETILNKLLN